MEHDYYTRLHNVSKRWGITLKDANELIVSVDSRQGGSKNFIPQQHSIVINNYFLKNRKSSDTSLDTLSSDTDSDNVLIENNNNKKIFCCCIKPK